LGYAPWIEQVWINYLTNALKYSGDATQVKLGGERMVNGTVRYWVRDYGPGLSEEEQAALFRPFTRLNYQVEGHGLGLSIVKRIVEKLDGDVGVESTPGEGSTFYFTLPAVSETDSDRE
jgi:signal transduction histidine kinase